MKGARKARLLPVMEVLPRRGGFGVIAGDVKKSRHISAVVQFLYSLVTAKKKTDGVCHPHPVRLATHFQSAGRLPSSPKSSLSPR